MPLQKVMPQDARIAQKKGANTDIEKILVRVIQEKHQHEGRSGELVGVNEAQDSMHESDGVVKFSAFQFETIPLSALVPIVDVDDMSM